MPEQRGKHRSTRYAGAGEGGSTPPTPLGSAAVPPAVPAMCLTTASNSDCYITHIAAQDLGSLVLQQLKVLQVIQGATAADETAEFAAAVLRSSQELALQSKEIDD